MSTTTTDRIEKRVLLRAPRARVWRALADSTEFGRWFQVSFSEPFRPGATLAGRITYPAYQHLVVQFSIEEMVNELRFSYRWHPHAVKPGVDYSGEPTTLVTFTLEEVEGGTLLTIVESGFDRIPAARRAEALKANEGGWTEQLKAIEAHLGRTP